MKRKIGQKISKWVYGMAVVLLLGGGICYLNSTQVIQAAEGNNIDGNAGGVTWGGRYFSWKLIVTDKGVKRPAYCINLGLKPTTGQEMTEKTTTFVNHPEFKRFVYAAHGANMKQLQQKYGLTDDEAWKGSIYVAHVIEHRLGYGPQVERLTEAEFSLLAIQEGRIGQYALELLDYAKNGNELNQTVSVSSTRTRAQYNPQTKRLETGVYTINDVQSDLIVVNGLSEAVYMIDAITGEKVDILKSKQSFKIVTENLAYTARFNQLTLKSRVDDFVPIIWQFDGVQDLIQAKHVSERESSSFTAEFESVVGDIEFNKIKSKDQSKLPGIRFNLLSSEGEIIASQVSDENGGVLFRNILAGSYHIQELPVKGDGLVDDVTLYPVDVKANQKVDLNGRKTIENKETITRVQKIDSQTKQCVQGAHLQIRNKSGSIVKQWINTCATDTYDVYQLPEGEYALEETIAPDKYQFAQPLQFRVLENGSETKLIMKDERTRLEMNKIDDLTQKPLAGAKFGVYKQDGVLAKMLDGEGREVDAIQMTKEDGRATFEGIASGDYVVKEIEPPKGYKMNSDMHVFIGQKGVTIRNFTNSQISVVSDQHNEKEEKLPKTGGMMNNRYSWSIILFILASGILCWKWAVQLRANKNAKGSSSFDIVR